MKVNWSEFYAPFTDVNIMENAPKSPGIYVLWVKLVTGKWRCIYAGQAKNIMERLLEHLGEDEPNECLRSKVGKFNIGYEFTMVEKQEDRDHIEKYLYDYYAPECCNQDPGGLPMEINTP